MIKPKTIGTRREVFYGYALRTAGGLTRKDLMKNSKGKIVSIEASKAAEERLKTPALEKFKVFVDSATKNKGGEFKQSPPRGTPEYKKMMKKVTGGRKPARK